MKRVKTAERLVSGDSEPKAKMLKSKKKPKKKKVRDPPAIDEQTIVKKKKVKKPKALKDPVVVPTEAEKGKEKEALRKKKKKKVKGAKATQSTTTVSKSEAESADETWHGKPTQAKKKKKVKAKRTEDSTTVAESDTELCKVRRAKKKKATKKNEKRSENENTDSDKEPKEEGDESDGGYTSDPTLKRRGRMTALANYCRKRASLTLTRKSGKQQEDVPTLSASASVEVKEKKVNFNLENKKEKLKMKGRNLNKKLLKDKNHEEKQVRRKEKVDEVDRNEEAPEEEQECEVVEEKGKEKEENEICKDKETGCASPKIEEWKEFLVTHFENSSVLDLDKLDGQGAEYNFFMKEIEELVKDDELALSRSKRRAGRKTCEFGSRCHIDNPLHFIYFRHTPLRDEDDQQPDTASPTSPRLQPYLSPCVRPPQTPSLHERTERGMASPHSSKPIDSVSFAADTLQGLIVANREIGNALEKKMAEERSYMESLNGLLETALQQYNAKVQQLADTNDSLVRLLQKYEPDFNPEVLTPKNRQSAPLDVQLRVPPPRSPPTVILHPSEEMPSEEREFDESSTTHSSSAESSSPRPPVPPPINLPQQVQVVQAVQQETPLQSSTECSHDFKRRIRRASIMLGQSILQNNKSQRAVELLDIRSYQQEERRNTVVKELLTNERNYAHLLWTVITQFQRPLYETAVSQPRGWNIGCDKINSIFAFVDIIHRYTTMLLSQLEERVDCWNEESCVGDIFLSMVDGLRVYRLYLENYPTASKILKECKTDEKFSQVLESLFGNLNRSASSQAKPVLVHQTLDSYLIAPVQKIPRYLSLLNTILKYTNPEHYDYELLTRAIEKMEGIAHEYEQAQLKSANLSKLFEIQNRLCTNSGRLPLCLVTSSRTFMDEARMLLFRWKNNRRYTPGRPIRGWVFLFDDIILLAKERSRSFRSSRQFILGGDGVLTSSSQERETEKEKEREEKREAKSRQRRLKYLFHLPLADCWITNNDVSSSAENLKNAITIFYPPEELHLSICMETESIKSEWLLSLISLVRV